MPSTVYKGDLSEITFGHESGLVLEHGFGGSDFVFTANSGARNLTADTSIIEFSGGDTAAPVLAGLLQYPKGMLVGSKLIFSGLAGGSSKFSTDDNYAEQGRSYTIIKHDITSASPGVTQLTITPALKTDHSSADQLSEANGKLHILPFATPACDTISAPIGNSALASSESVLTDQFVGLVSTVALPETKVDLKRYHVVGLGRDVAIQVPGRYTNVGGSFECNLHNGRWFYYCLGHEITNVAALTKNNGGATYELVDAAPAGTNIIRITGASAIPTVGTQTIAADNNSFVILHNAATDGTQLADIQTYRGTATGGNAVNGEDAWPNVGAANIFDKAVKQEVRRVVAHSKVGSGSSTIHTLWLDDPLQLNWAVSGNTDLFFSKYREGESLDSNNMFGSPNRTKATGHLLNPVEHLFFSRTTIPSFAMEVSVRRLDQDTNVGTYDGGTTDSKQLLRVFRGCKVKDWTLTADTDAALRLTANFDSALCYTDTGRQEASAEGDRYNAHRLFEDTASTLTNRKVAGIEKGTQKPYMFYNGTITVLGQQVGQVVSFTLTGKTGVEQYYTISGSNVVDSVTDQVPQAGNRNPKLAVEGKTEFDLEMEIIVDDPVFFHNMRRAISNYDEDNTDSEDADIIRLSFNKLISGGTVHESLDILMDDFYITEAPLPIPEDKGPIRSKLKILPKSVKVIAKDTVLHA